MSFPPVVNVPVFDGQGTSAVKHSAACHQALDDACTASGSLLLKSCHTAFLEELASLDSAEISSVGVDATDFATPESLLDDTNEQYIHNAVIAGTNIFLVQVLRYLAYVEASASASGSLTPFSDVLEANAKHRIGVVGFSSGILAACVVATSRSTVSFLTHSVEIYRLAFWVGVRSQQQCTSVLQSGVALKWHTESWSHVLMGAGVEQVLELLSKFHEDRPESETLTITAVINETTITVSGRPDCLASFTSELQTSNIRVQKSHIFTLYHAPILQEVKERIRKDVSRRQIQPPAASAITTPLRCSYKGDLIDSSSSDLLELLLDMILTEPVQWHQVTASIVNAVPSEGQARLLNFGPGSGLVRLMARGISAENISIEDEIVPRNVGSNDSAREPVAIVGMAVNMPGAPNIAKLWEVLEQGINTVSEIPSSRFDVSLYKDEDRPRSLKAHTANFVEDASLFDNKFFHISPREAKSMDPQQRLLLHTAQEALDDAGYVPNATSSFQQETFGCYVGVATDDYIQNLRESIDVYYSTGTLRSFLSGRISYAFKFSGPSVVTDTACSASVVCIYQACRALANGDCTAAIAGGVNVISSPDMTMGLDRAHFLSPTGQCKPFDVSADGYARSEGCGLFVLKRLSDAIKENDRILGVIRGVEVNQSGNAHSITHPHAPTQANLFERVLKRSGVDRSLVNVVEAHGTGTQAGDPNELESIRSIFAVKRTEANPLHITSVKANIGHLEAASGAAGLAKLLLMIRHQTIPRLISLQTLNPSIAPLDSDHVSLGHQPSFWAPARPGAPRMALLNNFGAAGSNTALLLEEFVTAPHDAPSASQFVFGASAKDEVALNKLRDRYLEFVQCHQGHGTSIIDIAYTSTGRRQMYDYRLAVTATSREELVEKLKRAPIQSSKGLRPSKVVFVFSGQGGQYLGMGRELYLSVPSFRKDIDLCHEILVSMGFPGVLSIILSDGTTSNLDRLVEFEAFQASLLSLQYALARLWMSWGLEPAAVVGHSIGEYAALVIAGVLNLKSALFIVASRVRLMVQHCPVDTTGMLAVNLGPEDIDQAMKASPSSLAGISVACFNSAVDTVLGGPISELKSLKEQLDHEKRCKSVLLAVPYAYHTEAMCPVSAGLTAAAEGVTLYAPKIPVVSNVTGTIVQPGDTTFFTADYFARHCAEPVQFTQAVYALASESLVASTRCFIEIGPHPTTLPMLRANPFMATFEPLLAASLNKKEEHWNTLTNTAASMYVRGFPLRWRKLYEHLSPTCVELPSYPFSYSKFWVEFKESATPLVSESTGASDSVDQFTMLNKWIERPTTENGQVAVFESQLSLLGSFIVGHRVGDHPLCPASVYHELALEGVQLASRELEISLDDDLPVLRSIEYVKPLIYVENDTRLLRTRVTHVDSNGGSFAVSSCSTCSTGSSEETMHCFGQFAHRNLSQSTKKFQRHEPILHREIASLTSNNDAESISSRTAYEVIFPRVVTYSEKYHTMKSLRIHPNGHEGYAVVKVPSDLTPGKFLVHPVFMDTMLHVSGFVANMRANSGDAYICSQVDSVKVVPDLLDTSASYGVYTKSAWVPEQGAVIADAYAVSLSSPQRIVGHLKGMHFRKLRLASLKRSLGGLTSHVAAPSTPEIRLPQIVATPQSTSIARRNEDDIRETVLGIIAATCDISLSEVNEKEDLSALGVDSLMSIEITSQLRSTFPESNLDARTLSMISTPAQMIEEVISKTQLAWLNDVPHSNASEASVDSNSVTLMVAPTPDDKEVDVRGIIASVLDMPRADVDESTDLEMLGLDSLSSIEAHHALSKASSSDLPRDLFEKHTTVRAIQKYISALRTDVSKVVGPEVSIVAAVPSLGPLPVPLQRSNSAQPPLFLFHDGSGLVNYYERVDSLDRDVWGIYNPKFSTGEDWSDVETMAAHYSKIITQTVSGPLLIGGWSFGGIVAFEAARQLLAQGREVRGVLLIDSPSPIDHVPLSDSLIQGVLSNGSKTSSSKLSKLVKRQFQLNSSMLGRYNPVRKGQSLTCKVALLRSRDGLVVPQVSGVPEWLADRSNPQQALVGWQSLVQDPIKMWDIPGHHFEAFYPASIKDVSRVMAESCNHLSRLE